MAVVRRVRVHCAAQPRTYRAAVGGATGVFTREALMMLVKRSIDADCTVEMLERLVAERSAPEFLRMDNGPEMTAHALRDWCVLSRPTA